jgi:hypothetical protein
MKQDWFGMLEVCLTMINIEVSLCFLIKLEFRIWFRLSWLPGYIPDCMVTLLVASWWAPVPDQSMVVMVLTQLGVITMVTITRQPAEKPYANTHPSKQWKLVEVLTKITKALVSTVRAVTSLANPSRVTTYYLDGQMMFEVQNPCLNKYIFNIFIENSHLAWVWIRCCRFLSKSRFFLS